MPNGQLADPQSPKQLPRLEVIESKLRDLITAGDEQNDRLYAFKDKHIHSEPLDGGKIKADGVPTPATSLYRIEDYLDTLRAQSDVRLKLLQEFETL